MENKENEKKEQDVKVTVEKDAVEDIDYKKIVADAFAEAKKELEEENKQKEKEEINVKEVVKEILRQNKNETKTEVKNVEAMEVKDINSIKSIDLKHYNPLTVFKEDQLEDAYKTGMWLRYLINQSKGRADEDAKQFCVNHGLDVGQKALNTLTDSEGGYLQPQQLINTLIVLLNKNGVCRQLYNWRTATTSPMLIPKLDSNVTSYFTTTEPEEKTTSDPVFEQIEVAIRTLYAITELSDEIVSDSIIDLADEVARLMSKAIQLHEDQVFLWGNGNADTTMGSIIGLITAITNVSDNAGIINPATNDGNWSSIVLADFNNVMAAVAPYAWSARENIAWLCSTAFYHRVMARLKSANETAIYNIEEGYRDKFLGYPVYFSETFTSVDHPNDPSVIEDYCAFGNFKQATAAASRQGETVKIDGGGKYFSGNKIAIKTVERIGYSTVEPGTAEAGGPVVILSAR